MLTDHPLELPGSTWSHFYFILFYFILAKTGQGPIALEGKNKIHKIHRFNSGRQEQARPGPPRERPKTNLTYPGHGVMASPGDVHVLSGANKFDFAPIRVELGKELGFGLRPLLDLGLTFRPSTNLEPLGF
jgi:hypothetical protein